MRVTIFFVFISMLLMLSLNLEKVEARCQPSGCSVWKIVPYKVFFRPACNKHDVCYACGVSNGWTRSDCDTTFYQDMYMLCRNLNSNERGDCRAAAAAYYQGVNHFGSGRFRNPSLKWCSSCPKQNGDPNAVLPPHARR